MPSKNESGSMGTLPATNEKGAGIKKTRTEANRVGLGVWCETDREKVKKCSRRAGMGGRKKVTSNGTLRREVTPKGTRLNRKQSRVK